MLTHTQRCEWKLCVNGAHNVWLLILEQPHDKSEERKKISKQRSTQRRHQDNSVNRVRNSYDEILKEKKTHCLH